jgi:hypothetical protein
MLVLLLLGALLAMKTKNGGWMGGQVEMKKIKRIIIPKSIESLFSLSVRLNQMAGNGKSANRNTSTDSSRVHYTKEKLFR